MPLTSLFLKMHCMHPYWWAFAFSVPWFASLRHVWGFFPIHVVFCSTYHPLRSCIILTIPNCWGCAWSGWCYWGSWQVSRMGRFGTLRAAKSSSSLSLRKCLLVGQACPWFVFLHSPANVSLQRSISLSFVGDIHAVSSGKSPITRSQQRSDMDMEGQPTSPLTTAGMGKHHYLRRFCFFSVAVNWSQTFSLFLEWTMQPEEWNRVVVLPP